MEQKESLLYLATKQFNLTEDEAAALLIENGELKENAVDLLLEEDKKRIQKLKDERTKYHDTGFQKAEKQFKSYAEETFKKLTGYSGTEDNFEAMFTAWHEAEKKKLVKNIQVDEDTVKKHPAYIALESERIPKTEYEKLQKDFDEFKTTQQRERVMGVVTDSAWSVVSAKNPILSDNQQVADNRRRDFLAKFSGYNYDLNDGKILVLDRDGKRIEDEHGNPKPFDAFVMELAALNFDFRAQEEKGNAGNKGGGSGGVIVVSEKPTTAAEYNAAIAKYSGAGEENAKMRIALKKYYQEHKKD